MTEDKMRKTITAIASAATLLLVILLSVLVYQWVTMGVQKKRIAERQESVETLKQQKEDAQDDLEFYKSDIYLEWAYFKLGGDWK